MPKNADRHLECVIHRTIWSIFLVVLFGLTGTARAEHFLTHPAVTPQGAAAHTAKALFEPGAKIKIKRDANVYITPENIPNNDRLLNAYSADQAAKRNGNAAPGLFGIATQAYRTQSTSGAANKAYTLADAMRDAIWRKKTAAKLKTLLSVRSICPDHVGSENGGKVTLHIRSP